MKKIAFFALFALIYACKNEQTTLFTSLPYAKTGIDFENTLTQNNEFNLIKYLYYYNGGGVAVGDLNNDSLSDVFFSGNRVSNQLYINKGNFSFENATQKAGLTTQGEWSTGVSMVDINADGFLDIYVCVASNYKGLKGKNKLYINQKNGQFTDQAAAYHLDFEALSTQAAWLDYDLDGDLDMYLLTHSAHETDNYGDTSLRNEPNVFGGNKLLENQQNVFVDVTQKAGILSSKIGYGLGVCVSDLDLDGYPDLYITNDFYENDYLYFNNKKGGFDLKTANATALTSNFSMGVDIADINNDLLPDIFSLDMKPEDEPTLKRSADNDTYDIYAYKHKAGYHYQYPRNALQLNVGNQHFSEIAHLAGVEATDWSWATLITDLDLDGYKDIFVANGIVCRPNDLDYLKFVSNGIANTDDQTILRQMPKGETENYCFRNKGDLTFENKSVAWGLNQKGCTNGAAYADLDKDGDQDLITSNINMKASVFRNNSPKNTTNYLKIVLAAPAPNTRALGTKVVAWAGGRAQVQENYTVRGFQSAVDYPLVFGLNAAKKADSLQIFWANGSYQVMKNIAANQTLYLSCNAKNELKNYATKQETAPTLWLVTTSYKHTENTYSDLSREKLMPWLLSTCMPKIAVSDGLYKGKQLVYIGRSGGEKPQNTGIGENCALVNPLPLVAGREDAGGVFFDANHDQTPDLLVASGGNRSTEPELLRPRLYLNKNGVFTQKTDAFAPEVLANAGCVATSGEYVFIGARSVVGSYGENPRSYLLKNDGTGIFTDITPKNLQNIGMITDAAFADLNQNGAPDLVFVGEFMPITIFYDLKKLETIPNSEGIYNSLGIADLNNDQRPDVVAGNFGLNSNLRASAAQPIELFTKDFDKNGSTEPILSYYRQGKRYAFASKDELVSQIPSKRKNFVEYAKYADAGFGQVFAPDELAAATHKKAVGLASAVWLNKPSGFVHLALPTQAQFAPIFAILPHDFNADGNVDLLLAGNYFGVIPKIGRLAASYGSLLLGNGRGGFTLGKLPLITGQVRDLKRLKNGSILVARNDDFLQYLK